MITTDFHDIYYYAEHNKNGVPYDYDMRIQ